MELIFCIAQGPVDPPFMYDKMNRTLLHLSRNSYCLILRWGEHSALKQSKSSCTPENGEGGETLGGFGGGGGAALGWAWAGGGDWLQRASWAWRAMIWAVNWVMCSLVGIARCYCC